MPATITGYSIGLFVHVLAVVLAFGPTFGYGFFVATAEASAPRSIPVVLRGIQRVDRFLVRPGLIVILLAGIYLLADADIDAGESWVTVGFVAILALLGMAHAYFRPNTQKALELAERDLEAGEELGDEYAAVARRLERGGKLAGLVVAIAIFFMVVKP
jgi:uncharacterized membrane protein